MNLINKKYNKLAVIGELKEKDKFGNKLWICQCDCGNNAIVSTHNLVSGHTKSCGCLHKEVLSYKNTKHGLWGTAIYQKWLDIKKRCYNLKSKDYKNYGGKGIKVCDEWKHLEGFINFYNWAINNGYSDKLTLDRIDNEKDYCPENCRWATSKFQSNHKTNNVFYTFKGEIKTSKQWCEQYNISQTTLNDRLKRGWTLEQALTISTKGKHKKVF